MARKKKRMQSHRCETLPVVRPEIGSLPLWCMLLFTLLLASLTELFLLRAEHALAKARFATFEGLLKKCAAFLRTTSENSNWPSSVMSSPLMMRGRRLLDDISSALGISREETRKPDQKKKDSGEESSAGGRDGAKAKPRRARHPGAAQKRYKPDETVDVDAQECPFCHSRHVFRGSSCILHQVLEIMVKRIVRHFKVWESVCADCGRHFRAPTPPEARYGFGTGAATLMSFLAALGMTRRKMEELFRQVFKMEISQGGIQNCLDRGSAAAAPHYGAIGRESRRMPVGHADETTSPMFGPAGKRKHWLWVLASSAFCFFMIMDTRSADAFARLVGDWTGILISDGFAVYLKWAGKARQSCLAHLLRKAERFAEDPMPGIARGGRWILAELRRLNRMADNPPTNGEYAAWRGRFSRCVRKYETFGGELGAYARHLRREADCIVTFLYYEGVDPTNNRAERAIRPYVCRRKTSFGCTSEHGEVDISRLLTLHETCRLNGRSTYDELKTAIEHHARGKTPSLYWIRKVGMKAGTRPPRLHKPNRLARPAEWYE